MQQDFCDILAKHYNQFYHKESSHKPKLRAFYKKLACTLQNSSSHERHRKNEHLFHHKEEKSGPDNQSKHLILRLGIGEKKWFVL